MGVAHTAPAAMLAAPPDVRALLGDSPKKYAALYFSAHWCGPCRRFTPMLAEWYTAGASDEIDIVFVSSDRDQAAFEAYFADMPWLALPFSPERRKQLGSQFGVQGIPTLIVFDGASGELITAEAREDVEQSPSAALATWTPEGQRCKAKRKQEGYEKMKAALPAAVDKQLRRLGIAQVMGAVEVQSALQGAAQREFGQSISVKRIQQAVQEMIERFGE